MSSNSIYTVAGMTCDHCVRSVRSEVARVPGVAEVEVDLGAGTVTVAGTGAIDDALVRAAVEDAGYEVTGSL